MRHTLPSLLGLGLFATVAVAQPTAYTIQDLGSLSGNIGSAAALGLNDNAFTTGWSTAPATSTLASSRRPFLYNPLSMGPISMFDLLPGLPGSGQGEDINNFNVTVGTFRHTNQDGPRGVVVGGIAAVVPPVQYVNPLPGGNATSATDVNDATWVVGSSNLASTNLAVRPTHAILWRAGQTTDLGTLGGSNSEATAINNANVIVGVSDMPVTTPTTRVIRRGFYHPGPGYSMIALSSLTNTGSSRANDVSDTAIIVGASDWVSPTITPTSGIPTRAVMWTPATVSIVNLGTLRNTDRSSEALAVNSAGHIVGWSGTPTNSGPLTNGPSTTAFTAIRAFIWHNGAMHDLNSMIPTASGWILHVATDINEDGQIVGWGRRLSPTAAASPIRAFLLTPVR